MTMKILVANRGEIAVRILRTLREMGLPSVAIYTDVDEATLHRRYADEAVALGEAKAYCDPNAILEAARKSGATAIHPGYGFLSENAAFARAVEEAGLIFIGPRPETIALMGDKLSARRVAREVGLPVLPGSDDPLPVEVPLEMAEQIKYPVLVKATAGGGGRGIRMALSSADLAEMVIAARDEALAAFGDGTIYLEPLVQQARHIEVQILGDGQGKVLCLGERECSIQRRRQKLIEEAPAPGLSVQMRRQIHEAARQLGKTLNYRGLGTVEFLLDAEQKFHFIEVNPRIQVEHPVTEMVTGLDMVKEQVALAIGEPLTLRQHNIDVRGVAIESRILAEDTLSGFLPASGQISYVKEPGGPGVRIDSAMFQGMPVSTDYDSLLAKVITWAQTRTEATVRMRRAIDEYQIGGVTTNLDFLKQIIESSQFVSGHVTTTFLETFKPDEFESSGELEREIALVAALYAHRQQSQAQASEPGRHEMSRWQTAAWQEQMSGRG
jgi:acetyl-CoA carboxylase biotin carboxylase subunit